MYKLGLKLWSINTDYYYEEAIRLYEEGVYDYIELYVVPDTQDTLSKWKKLNIPFIIHNAHSKHNFNLANAEKKSVNRKIYEQSKKFADELQAKYIIFHGGIDGDIKETAEQLASFNEIRALIENKPYVALPNKMNGKFCRGYSPKEIKIVQDVANCGFCFDVGHAICSANSQNKEQYSFLHELMSLNPTMFHLSDVADMNSPYDAHHHLGTGQLDIERLKREIFPSDAIISVETDKDSKENLNDFVEDVKWLKSF